MQRRTSKLEVCEYHIISAAKLQAFVLRYLWDYFDLSITEENAQIVQRNREILCSVLKCVEYCGRQGIAIRGHRDDDTSFSLIKGTLKHS